MWESTAVAIRFVDAKGIGVVSLTEDSFDSMPCEGLEVINFAKGVFTGDRVVGWMKNCSQFISAIYRIFRAGYVAVPINSFLTATKVSWILNAAAEVLIADDKLVQKLTEILPNHPKLLILKTSKFTGLSCLARFLVRFNFKRRPEKGDNAV